MSEELSIRNHQMNVIVNEINKLKYALNHTADKSVIEGVKFGVEAAILDLFPSLFEYEKDGFLFSVKDIHSEIPDLTSLDYDKLTYLSWTDISTSKLFMI